MPQVSSVDADPVDQLLQEARRNPEAVPDLVKATAPEAFRRLGGDAWALRQTYETLLTHLHEAGSSTSFLPWFQQIAGPHRGRVEVELPDQVLQELLRLKPASRRSLLNWFGDCLARASGSGALLTMTSGVGFLLHLHAPHGDHAVREALALTVFGALAGSGVGLLLGPMLARPDAGEAPCVTG